MMSEGNNNLPSTHTNLALHDIQNKYMKNAQSYTQGLQHYTLAIKKISYQIQTLKNDNESEEKTLKNIEDEIRYIQHTLDKLNETVIQKVLIIEELDETYAKALAQGTRDEIKAKKEKELQKILLEIESNESIVLEEELRRVNLLTSLKPKRQEILNLKTKLQTLRLEKEYYESTQIAQIGLLSNYKEEPAIIDTDVL